MRHSWIIRANLCAISDRKKKLQKYFLGVAVLADTEVFEELQHLDYIHKILDNIARYKARKPDSAHKGVDL
jgi:hypothetical protein